MSSHGLKIAIIGAGIAPTSSTPYIVYESDSSRTAREQGGPINVHYSRGAHATRPLRYSLQKNNINLGCETNTFGDQHGRNFLHHNFATDDEKFYPGADGIGLQSDICCLISSLKNLCIGMLPMARSGPTNVSVCTGLIYPWS